MQSYIKMWIIQTYLRSGDKRPNRVDNDDRTEERDTDNMIVFFYIYMSYNLCAQDEI
jgi:hypothetical protein